MHGLGRSAGELWEDSRRRIIKEVAEGKVQHRTGRDLGLTWHGTGFGEAEGYHDTGQGGRLSWSEYRRGVSLARGEVEGQEVSIVREDGVRQKS